MTKKNDIFISYKREDRKHVHALAKAFMRSGFTVWWDTHLVAGQRFDEVIEDNLRNSRCVVVVWSKTSIMSNWVKEEAAYAREEGLLLPVIIDNVTPPIAFRRLKSVDLSGWNGSLNSPVIEPLIRNLQNSLGEGSIAQDTDKDDYALKPHQRMQDRRKNQKRWWEFWK